MATYIGKERRLADGRRVAAKNAVKIHRLRTNFSAAVAWPVPPWKPRPFSGPVTRHLLYHVGPFAGNGIWQRNVKILRERMHLFNGRRVVAIVTGPQMDPPSAVREAFGRDVSEYIVLPNDSHLREVVTYVPLWERVETEDPDHVTFYAHAKGVTRPADDSTTVHRWTDIMYESLLDYYPLVERTLEEFPVAGSFKKLSRGFSGSASAWHYSGTFFWVRNFDFFRRNWRSVDQRWWGSESHVGVHYRAEEAGRIFMEGSVGVLDLYDFSYFHGTILPAWEQWKREHAHERTGVYADANAG